MLSRREPTPPQGADVAGQKAEFEREILVNRSEQRAAELNKEQFVATELRAMAALDQSRAGQSRCDRIIVERIAAINSLQDEIAALPQQRQP